MTKLEPTREGRPIVRGPFILAMGGVLAALAFALHPDVLGSRDWSVARGTDAVSLEYLRIELRRRPGDRLLRLAYVRALVEVGQLEPAAHHGAPLLEGDGVDAEALDLLLTIDLERARAADGGARAALEGGIVVLLERALTLELDASRRERFVGVALEVRAPRLAARFVDEASGLEAIERVARLLDEAGGGSEATTRWLRLAEHELAGGARRDRLARAVAALEGEGRLGEARELLARWLGVRPDEPLAMDAAIRIDRARSDLVHAFRLSRRRVEARPDDPSALRAHIEIALARGKPMDGLEAARRLSEVRPGDRAARVLHAHVAEWSGRGDEALSIWWALARAGDDEAAVESERLARHLGADEVLLEVLSERVRLGSADPEVVGQVVYLAERVGEPERARATLLDLVGRPQAPKAAAVDLARLEARMGLGVTAVERWRRIDERYGTSADEVVEWSTLAWRYLGPRPALQILVGADALGDERVAEATAELAHLLGESGLAVAALRRLETLGRLAPHQTLRLVLLLRTEGLYLDAVEVAAHGLAQHPDPELLLRGLESALDAGRPERAAALLELSPEAEREARARIDYWRLRARLGDASSRPGEVRAALEQVVQLDPGSARAQADLLWLLLELDDREGLASWLRALAGGAVNRPLLWRPVAAAFERLRRDGEALRFYALAAGARPADWPFWLDYANCLERVGRADAALRLRRYGLTLAPRDPVGRLLLGRGVLGEAEQVLVARQVVSSPASSSEARRVAALALLTAGEHERSAAAIRGGPRAPGPSHVAWFEASLAVALAAEDDATIVELLHAVPTGASPALVAEGHARVGRYEDALALALASRVDGRGGVAREALTRYLEGASARRSTRVGGAASFHRLGRLSAVGGRATCSAIVGAYRYSAEASIQTFDDGAGRRLGVEVGGEAQVTLGLERAWRRGSVALTVGLHGQPRGPTVVQAAARLRHRLDAEVELAARLSAFEIVSETPLAYTLTARDRLGTELRARLAGRLALGLSVDLEHIHDRGGGTLAVGALTDARVALDLSEHAGERIEPYVGARALARALVRELPSGLADLPDGFTPEALFPDRFLALGAGVTLVRGDLGSVSTSPVGLRWRLDAWTGWQWPLDRFAYRLEASLGARLLGPDELSLEGFLGNLLGGLDDLQAGLQIAYRWRLDP